MKKRIGMGAIGLALVMISSLCWGQSFFAQREACKKGKILFAYGEETLYQEIDHGQWTVGPDGHTKKRNRIAQSQEIMQGPGAALLSGFATTTMNCNLDENMSGPCWGEFEWPLSATEKWCGVWEGYFNFALVVGSYHGNAHGEGGRLKGMTLDMDTVYTGYGKPAVNFIKILNWNGK
jgi:hypothetical protein